MKNIPLRNYLQYLHNKKSEDFRKLVKNLLPSDLEIYNISYEKYNEIGVDFDLSSLIEGMNILKKYVLQKLAE